MNNRIKILGTRIDLETYKSAIEKIEARINSNSSTTYVTLTCVDSMINAYKSPLFRNICNNAFLSLPDGLPLVWVARSRGNHAIRNNTRGTEMMYKFFENTSNKQYKHFFYGGKEGVAEQLKNTFEAKFEGVKIVGTYCPPFRKLSEAEDNEICEMINASKADVVWVGLGAPKQEYWMYDHINKLDASIMVGVGAAFDFLSGNKKEAPVWMRRVGLEWFFRLINEPQRLWKRYLVGNSQFVYLLIKERLKIL